MSDEHRLIRSAKEALEMATPSVDREALAKVIFEARNAWANDGDGESCPDEAIAHALIAAGYVRDPQPEPKVCPFGDECDLTVAYMAGAASKYAVRYPTEPAGDKVEALVKAAQAVVDRWDSIDWKAPPTAEVMNQLRAALASIGGQNNG